MLYGGATRLHGFHPDDRVAARAGHTENAVRQMRERLEILNSGAPVWTPEELAMLGTAPDD
jgi:hypothetical protein